MTILRTDSDNQDFVALVKQLDEYLTKTDGDEHAFYDKFNKIDKIKHVVIAYADGIPKSCGAFKEYLHGTVEIKRMYTVPESRGVGMATYVLAELEKWASELSYEKTILETGNRQPEAIAFYLKNRYIPIPNYGQYAQTENSVCFEKKLTPNPKG